MEIIASRVTTAAISVVMNEEAVIIEGHTFEKPPTVGVLTDIFKSAPRRHLRNPYPSGEARCNWIWDDLGIVVEGRSEINIGIIYVYFALPDTTSARANPESEVGTTHSEGNLPVKVFSGLLNVYGIDVGQPDGHARLEQRLTPENIDFRPSSKGGPTEIISKSSVLLRNYRTNHALAGHPDILFQKDSGVAFTYPRSVELPAPLQPMPDERVLGQTERLGKVIESIPVPHRLRKVTFAINVPFCATVSNRRLAITTGERGEKLSQWSLNDIRDIAVRPNVDALKDIPVDAAWLLRGRVISADELPDGDKPPYHVLEIDSYSKGPTSFIFQREITHNDRTLPQLLDLEDCLKNAISRYRGKIPGLPLGKDQSLASSDPNRDSLSATQKSVNDKLIPCPLCGNQVSPEAVNCTYCGQPIAGGLFRINRGTREQTPKFVKVSRPLGWSLLILSGGGFLTDVLVGDGTHHVPWVVGACIAVCLLVYIEVGQWWHQS